MIYEDINLLSSNWLVVKVVIYHFMWHPQDIILQEEHTKNVSPENFLSPSTHLHSDNCLDCLNSSSSNLVILWLTSKNKLK